MVCGREWMDVVEASSKLSEVSDLNDVGKGHVSTSHGLYFFTPLKLSWGFFRRFNDATHLSRFKKRSRNDCILRNVLVMIITHRSLPIHDNQGSW